MYGCGSRLCPCRYRDLRELASGDEVLMTHTHMCIAEQRLPGQALLAQNLLERKERLRRSLDSNQVPGLVAGILVGLTIAWLCPHEPVYATTGDRAPHFSMLTIPVSDAAKGIIDPVDGVFVLDLVTAQLKGA